MLAANHALGNAVYEQDMEFRLMRRRGDVCQLCHFPGARTNPGIGAVGMTDADLRGGSSLPKFDSMPCRLGG